MIEWLFRPENRRQKGIVRMFSRRVPIRGLSCKVGPELAMAVLRREAWAVVMCSQIQLRT